MSARILRRYALVALSVAVVSASAMVTAPFAAADPAGSRLVISEAYLNGGSSGASFANKFIELYNPTSSALGLAGDTLQYRAATSTVTPSGSQMFALTGTVPSHGHFLIQLPSNGANGAPLPTPDVSTGSSVNPSGST